MYHPIRSGKYRGIRSAGFVRSVSAEQITDEPQEVDTLSTDAVFAGICIPADTQFTLEVDYGEKCILKGNREGIGHGKGDWILVTAKEENGRYVPDFSDAGRVVNGQIFRTLYQPLKS